MSKSSNEDGEQKGTVTLTESERYRLLSEKRRRVALGVLAERTTPVGIDELAAEIVSRESDSEDSEHVERVATLLHHNHLPKLSDSGIIDYDSSANVVETCRVQGTSLLT